MNEDERELERRLFAAATVLIETAHEEAASGQSADLSAEDYLDAAKRLQSSVRETAVLGEAIMIIAKRSINPGRDSSLS